MRERVPMETWEIWRSWSNKPWQNRRPAVATVRTSCHYRKCRVPSLRCALQIDARVLAGSPEWVMPAVASHNQPAWMEVPGGGFHRVAGSGLIKTDLDSAFIHFASNGSLGKRVNESVARCATDGCSVITADVWPRRIWAASRPYTWRTFVA